MELGAIYLQLAALLRAIDRELTGLLPSASLPLAGSSAYERLAGKLDQWERQLAQIARVLSSQLHALALQGQYVQQLPRASRYPARQSIGDRTQNIDAALKELAAVRARLDALFDRIGRPTGPEVVKAIEKLATTAFKEAELTRAATRELQSSITKSSGPVLHGAAPAAGPDLLVSVAVVGRLMHILVLRYLARAGKGPPGT